MDFRIVKKKILIIPIPIIVISVFLYYSLSCKEILEKVYNSENEDISNSNNIALMLQKEDGTYEESTSSSNFPTNMKFNSELSGCIDVNGTKIDNVLKYDEKNNKLNIKVTGTTYCYVYFDLDNSLNNKIINSSDIWKSTLEDDGYRYVGTNPDNYICFGTTDKDTCINDTDKYMYRIIGIFEDEAGNKHAKLIKKEALNTTYAWHSSQTDVDWNESDLYKGLNGSYFLTNTSYPYMQDAEWTDKIATWNYTMTNTKTYENYNSNSVYGPNYGRNTGKAMYLHELNRSSKSNETCYYNYGSSPADADCNVGEWKNLSAKISLMYASDYALSLGNDALSYTSHSNGSTLKTGWMHLWKNENDPNVPYSNYERTMSRTGSNRLGYYYAIEVMSTGGIGSSGNPLAMPYAVRPVFYLASDVEILGGTGTITDPYMITY